VNRALFSSGRSSGTGRSPDRTALPSAACPIERRTTRSGVPLGTRSMCRSERPPRVTSNWIRRVGEALRGRFSGRGVFPRGPFELPRCIRTTRSRIWRLGRARLPQHPSRQEFAPNKGFSGPAPFLRHHRKGSFEGHEPGGHLFGFDADKVSRHRRRGVAIDALDCHQGQGQKRTRSGPSGTRRGCERLKASRKQVKDCGILITR